MSLALEVRRLSQRDLCDDFSAGSGEDEVKLNEFFRRYAKKHQARQISATSVAVAGTTIAGFVTITPSVVPAELIKDRVNGLGRYPAPVLLLARMATDARCQRQGVGSRLMRNVVFARALELADGFGCVGVYVDPKPTALAFYSQFGFTALPVEGRDPAPMFLPLATIRAALATSPAEVSHAAAPG